MADDPNTPPAGPPATPPVVDPPEWTPPTREEWDAHQAKLKAANKESADRRGELAALRKQHETDAEKAQREAADAAAATLKPAFAAVAAKAALLEADAKPDRAAALAKLVDHATLDVTNGEVTGLDAEVTRLKAEYPEFFRDTAGAPPVTPARAQIGSRKPDGSPMGPLEQLAAQMAGRSK